MPADLRVCALVSFSIGALSPASLDLHNHHTGEKRLGNARNEGPEVGPGRGPSAEGLGAILCIVPSAVAD